MITSWRTSPMYVCCWFVCSSTRRICCKVIYLSPYQPISSNRLTLISCYSIYRSIYLSLSIHIERKWVRLVISLLIPLQLWTRFKLLALLIPLNLLSTKRDGRTMVIYLSTHWIIPIQTNSQRNY